MWIRPFLGGEGKVRSSAALLLVCKLFAVFEGGGGALNRRFHCFIEGKTFTSSVCVHSRGIDFDGSVHVLRITMFLTLPAFSVVMSYQVIGSLAG